MDDKIRKGCTVIGCKTVGGTMEFICNAEIVIPWQLVRCGMVSFGKQTVSFFTHTTGGSQLLPTEEVWKGLEAVGESQHLTGWLAMTPKHVFTTTDLERILAVDYDTWVFPTRVVIAENIWFVFMFPPLIELDIFSHIPCPCHIQVHIVKHTFWTTFKL